MVQHFRSLKVGELSLIANKSHDRLIVMVETSEEANIYDTDPDDPGPADIFDNLHSKWNATIEGKGINLAVLSYENRMVRESTPEKVLEKIEKDVKRLVDVMEIDPSDVGIMICSIEITRLCFKNDYDYLNVLVANKTDKRKKFPIKLPFDSEFKWTNSIPIWLWSKSGGIKDDGEGINLLGFVVRAGYVLMHKQTEGSIYKKMRAYHTGKYGSLKIIQTIKEFDLMMDDLEAKKFNSIDTETDNLNRIHNTMLAIQFCTVNKRTDIPTMWVLPVHHSETPWTSANIKYIKKRLRAYFEIKSEKQVHIYQNAKFDLHQFMSFLKLRWYAARIYDVSSGSFTLEENQKFLKILNTKAYALEHMERCMEYDRPSELVIKKADRGRMASFTIQQIADYGVIDVLTPLFIMFEQIEIAKARGYKGFFTLITRQIGPMIYMMTEMEHNGISVDIDYLRDLASPIGAMAERIRQTAKELAESPSAQKANKILLDKSSFQSKGLFGKAKEPQLWNIRDQKHLELLFFEVLGLQPVSFGKDGSGSLNARFKKVYRHTKEVSIFAKYGKLSKLKSAFANALYKLIISSPDMKFDQRIRQTFQYLWVLTGRVSVVNPNSQQIPQHGDDAKDIKRQFRVKPRRIIVKRDMSGHEVRVSGNITLDPAICEAVDQVNKATYKYRIASEDQLEKATAYLGEFGDLHINNYYTFYEVRINKKDPRRQDAKTAIFATTYGSMPKAIGQKMHSERLFTLEDLMVKHHKAAKPEDVLTKDVVKATEKEIRWLRTEAAEDFYLDKATKLLKTLYGKWAVLDEFIKNEQEKARVNNVVFGPHQRPRHLWGYLHFDKFIGFAMNRRVFNSEGQGYASDYGFTTLYLSKKMQWKLTRRGYHIDNMQTNAVHDSGFNDCEFKFLPILMYIEEHAMIGETEKYYNKYFGITPKTQYGFEFEIGVCEAEMKAWNGRLEGGKDNLIDLIKHYGPQTGYSAKEIEDVIHDAKIIYGLRMEELRSKNPDKCTLFEPHIFDRIMPRLKAFKSANKSMIGHNSKAA